MQASEHRDIVQDSIALIIAFCHAADRADGAAVAGLFVGDGTWISGRKVVTGAADLARHFSERAPDMVVRHLIGATHVVTDGADTADATTTYLVFAATQPGNGKLPPLEAPFSMGEWHSHLVRLPEGWRIATHEVKRLMQRQHPA